MGSRGDRFSPAVADVSSAAVIFSGDDIRRMSNVRGVYNRAEDEIIRVFVPSTESGGRRTRWTERERLSAASRERDVLKTSERARARRGVFIRKLSARLL